MNRQINRAVVWILVLGALPAAAQTFSLDDDPVLSGGFGSGAEDEFGLAAAVLAPSPSLAVLPAPFDGTLFSPGVPPALAMVPNGAFVDAFSTNHARIGFRPPLKFHFTVDRATTGAAGSAVAAEAAVNQQASDIFVSTATFPHPIAFVGTLGGGGFAGALPSAGAGGSNTLGRDESTFGFVTAAGVVGPGVPAGPYVAGSHDNVDALDLRPLVPNPNFPAPAGAHLVSSYFAIAPTEAASVGASAADIFDVAPLAAGTVPVPYASAGSMGLDPTVNSDSIDALVVWDLGRQGGPANNGPGAEPLRDFALFSLAPGSATLASLGLSADDIFFTDFTGTFGVYAFGTDLGLTATGSFPFQNNSNIDGFDVVPVPEPRIGMLLGILASAMMLARRRSHESLCR